MSKKSTAPTPYLEGPCICAGGLATAPTPQSQPQPSPLRQFKGSLTFLKKVRGLKHLSLSSYSQEELKGFDGMTQDTSFGQRPQTSQTGLPSVTPTVKDLSPLISAQAGEEDSATSTPTTFPVSPSVHSTAPTSTFTPGPSSPQSFSLHPDLIAVNQRITELEALAEQSQQEHHDYVKNAQGMEATWLAPEEEVVSAVDAINAANKKTSLEAKESFKPNCERLEEIRDREIAEDFLKDARRTFEHRQKKYAAPPPEPWLEIVSKAVALNLLSVSLSVLDTLLVPSSLTSFGCRWCLPNLLGGVALGIGRMLGPLISDSF
ncbi:hypothetical protein FRC00_005500 [Tulasnella sp. 408]|nr:hypothetical protein FRC00_005500 [Tulasnella sp. 408]